MRVSIVGLGHVGLTTAACLAHVGHDVLGTDDDLPKLRVIARGEVPFFEPNLQTLLRQGLDSGRLRIEQDASQAARHAEVVLICVGTPIAASGEPDLANVERVARRVSPHLAGYTVLVEKSTVPVGTGDWLRKTARRTAPGVDLEVASNPEFLREGLAVEDTLRPSRVVVGAQTERSHAVLRQLYAPILQTAACPYIATDVATAELIKLASNAFLATKISFINAIADVCEAAGADVQTVAAGMGTDPRIGSEFLQAGIGYGGYCLPKDVAAFRYRAAELGVDLGLLDEVAHINAGRRTRIVSKLRGVIGNIDGKRVAVWGLAFKRDTDDLREAPALDVIGLLEREGAEIVAYDPGVGANGGADHLRVRIADDPYTAAEGSSAVVICTDWEEFRGVDLRRLREVMAEPVIVDGRNLLTPQVVTATGFVYASIGRPVLYPDTARLDTLTSPNGPTRSSKRGHPRGGPSVPSPGAISLS